jgi:putative flippase GtrA
LQLFRFLVVGVGNTLVSVTVIFLLMRAGVGDVLANLGGYVVGIALSFVANGRWTFNRRALTRSDLVRYVVVVVTAYAANLAALIAARDVLQVPSEIAQLCGMGTYTVVGYLGARWFAFRPRDGEIG